MDGRDKLSPEDRALVERTRGGCESGVTSVVWLLDVIDRLAPAPKPLNDEQLSEKWERKADSLESSDDSSDLMVVIVLRQCAAELRERSRQR